MHVSPRKAGFDRKRLGRIGEHLEKNYIEPGKIAGCQVAVSRHGQLACFESFGCADRERNVPVRDDTIFRIYSMTKPITSVALMTLFEQGYFQLDDPVSRYIPEWKEQQVWVSGDKEDLVTKPAERPTTFRHVLSHTGGLSYGWTNHPVDKAYRREGVQRGEGDTLRSMIEGMARTPLFYTPGDAWLYSLSTDVCAYLVEAISGMRFDQYLKKVIFKPLGMDDTAFFVAEEKRQRFAANYQREPDKSLKLIDDPATSTYLRQPTFLSGGGGLTSTTADYLRFCEMLRGWGELDGVRILGRPTLELMTKNHLPGGKDLGALALGAFSETPFGGIGFGLGFAMVTDEIAAASPSRGDYYWGGAASTIFWVDPNEDLVVVFMTQLMPSATFNFRGQLKNIIYAAIDD